jgi:dTDP-4-dehydrorhamnose reductase
VTVPASRPRILLTGGTGQVGWELRCALAPLGEVLAPGRTHLDLADAAALRAAVRDFAPAAIVNCAAYTDVEGAEREVDAARAVNVHAPEVLATEAARAGALMVHFSTDYVFDGRKGAAYTEGDATAPLNAYGRTKLEGEEAVTAAGGAHLVFRTSWVYGLRGRNFLRTIQRLAGERDVLRVVDDQIGAPTWSRMVAEGVAVALGRLAVRGRGFAGEGGPWGTYHLSAGGETTWHGFAEAILASRPEPGGRSPRLEPVSSEAYGAGAVRPRYSVLDCGRAAATFGVRLPGWRDQLALAVAF